KGMNSRGWEIIKMRRVNFEGGEKRLGMWGIDDGEKLSCCCWIVGIDDLGWLFGVNDIRGVCFWKVGILMCFGIIMM
ncbi:hypothetical protein, partial [Bacillus sp. WP8]|uniref:hypothetical protein n=1 Tax=Bacillus sp. WP8 TaxID=756828 RepID=UPI001C93034D